MKTKEKVYTNKEIIKELISIKKVLKEDVNITSKKTKIGDFLISLMFTLAFIIFFYGLSSNYDWNKNIYVGILLFILSVFFMILRDN